jgi:proteasome lid subunit RPN8/RPN11
MALKIAESDWQKLRCHGEETYPHECCGVLLGEIAEDGTKTVHGTVPCGNTRTDSPEDRYHIDPGELVRIQRQARGSGLDIVGFYHSHPDCAARWSQTDLAEAHWTGCSYVITSVEKGHAGQTNSFALAGEETNKHFDDEVITLQPVLAQESNA